MSETETQNNISIPYHIRYFVETQAEKYGGEMVGHTAWESHRGIHYRGKFFLKSNHSSDKIKKMIADIDEDRMRMGIIPDVNPPSIWNSGNLIYCDFMLRVWENNEDEEDEEDDS
jgi:hypothetical protein